MGRQKIQNFSKYLPGNKNFLFHLLFLKGSRMEQ